MKHGVLAVDGRGAEPHATCPSSRNVRGGGSGRECFEGARCSSDESRAIRHDTFQDVRNTHQLPGLARGSVKPPPAQAAEKRPPPKKAYRTIRSDLVLGARPLFSQGRCARTRTVLRWRDTRCLPVLGFRCRCRCRCRWRRRRSPVPFSVAVTSPSRLLCCTTGLRATSLFLVPFSLSLRSHLFPTSSPPHAGMR